MNQNLGPYSPTILENILGLVLQIFLYLEAFECNTTSDWLNRSCVTFKITNLLGKDNVLENGWWRCREKSSSRKIVPKLLEDDFSGEIVPCGRFLWRNRPKKDFWRNCPHMQILCTLWSNLSMKISLKLCLCNVWWLLHFVIYIFC